MMGHWDGSLSAAIALANLAAPANGVVATASPARYDIRAGVLHALGKAAATTPKLADEDVEVLVDAGRSLWPVLSAAAAGDLDCAARLLNALLDVAAPRPRLTRHNNTTWHLRFGTDSHSPGCQWSADLLLAVAILLGSEELSRLHQCAAGGCDRVLLDNTRSRTQRYCSGRCQNRSKVAAFRGRAARA